MRKALTCQASRSSEAAIPSEWGKWKLPGWRKLTLWHGRFCDQAGDAGAARRPASRACPAAVAPLGTDRPGVGHGAPASAFRRHARSASPPSPSCRARPGLARPGHRAWQRLRYALVLGGAVAMAQLPWASAAPGKALGARRRRADAQPRQSLVIDRARPRCC
jgi:hypothetical protein